MAISAFSTLQPLQVQTTQTLSRRQRRWKPKCTHTSMVRLYHVDFRCWDCQLLSPFGWIYRCSEDREVILHEAKRNGIKVR